MRYCHDCGAANAVDAAICRICGQVLSHERSADPCPSCGALLVAGAGFCPSCGAAAVRAPDAPLSAELPGSLKVEEAIAAERQASAARIGAMLNLGSGLDLPDWLKRAAAEQPAEPAQPIDVAPNPFGPVVAPASTAAAVVTAPVAQVGAAHADQVDGLAAASPRSPASMPTGGLAEAMPSWLRQPPTVDDPAPPVASGTDVTDTSSFISEHDLPEWIRQLAAAEEAKQAEEARQAAATARTTSERERDADAAKRPDHLLPGETVAGGPAANAWLARGDRPPAPEAAMATAWTQVRGAPAALPAATYQGGTDLRAHTTDSAPTATVGRARGAPPPPMRLRRALMVAVALALVALIAVMMLAP